MKKSSLVISAFLFAAMTFGLASCSNINDAANVPEETVVADPEFSVKSGAIITGTELLLTTTTKDAVIYYTTDGSNPSEEESKKVKYENAIVITDPCTIRAYAVKEGKEDSKVTEASYTIRIEGTLDKKCIELFGHEFSNTSEVIIIPAGEIATIENDDDSTWMHAFGDTPPYTRVKGVFVKGRKIKLSSFVMGQYAVTNELVTSVNKGSLDTEGNINPYVFSTWVDAIIFCNKLSLLAGYDPVYSYEINGVQETDPDKWIESMGTLKYAGEKEENYSLWNDNCTIDISKNGYRLPTEAEWEFAARGGDESAPDWDYAFSGVDAVELPLTYSMTTDSNLDSVAWYESNSTHNVISHTGLKKHNRLNLYDMTGNTMTFCNDFYTDNLTSCDKVSCYMNNGYAYNPMGPSSETLRAIRGADYDSTVWQCGVSFRYYSTICRTSETIGIRLVRSTGNADQYPVYEPVVLSSIEVTASPSKTEYYTIDKEFDSTGLEVTAHYSDDTSKVVTSECVFSGFNVSTTGPHTVTISYTDGEITKETTITITSSKKPLEYEPTYAFHETVTDAGTVTITIDGEEKTFRQVYFGDFPQTVAPSDGSIKFTTETEKNGWYVGSDGNYYEKCLENEFPGITYYSNGDRVQSKSAGSYRYFKVEPVLWRVLDSDYNGTGTSLLLADKALMALTYNESSAYSTIDFWYYKDGTETEKAYPSGYKLSKIRSWLNGLAYYTSYNTNETYKDNGFLQLAFTNKAKSIIADTEVVNNYDSTKTADGSIVVTQSSYICKNTTDKIFLLSCAEVTNASYGFPTYNSRLKHSTDYTLANYGYEDRNYPAKWWLRSPYDDSIISIVHYNGYVAGLAYNTGYGEIVPALCITAGNMPE